MHRDIDPFYSGIDSGQKTKEIRLSDRTLTPDSDEKKPKIDKIGMIVQGQDVATEQGNKFRDAGLIFLIKVEDVG